jgi:Transposase DDE domain
MPTLPQRRPTPLILVKPETHLEPADPAVIELAPSRREWLIEKYDGTRLNEQRTSSYQRTTDSKVSRTDPEASPMNRFTGDRTKLGYHTHYVVDGGKSRIILAALVTPASVMDNTPMLDLARWTRFRWQLKPKIAVGDTKYGTVENIVGLERDGLRAYVPTTDFSQRTKFYPAERFPYEAARELYRCPQGVELSLYSRREREEVLVYRAPATVCNQCPVKAECTGSRSGRHNFRSFFQEYLDRVHGYRESEAYKKALRKRMVWVEPLFGEAKQWHQQTRFRLRGLRKVNTEGLLTAAGQNIKRLLSRRAWGKSGVPSAGAAVCAPDPPYLLLTGLRLAA